MLIVDSVTAPRIARARAQEEAEAKLRGWVADQLSNAVYVQDNDVSPANFERQLGKVMPSPEMEKRLEKLSTSLVFEHNPFNRSKKAVYVVRRGEGKVYICAYENGIMPEHSVMRVKEEITRDYDAVGVGPTGRKLDRKDLPKYTEVDGKITFEEEELLPGFKKTLIPYGEYKRGWRTVLVKLVEAKVLTPTQVESIFGADNRPEWASHMGKQAHALPW